MPERILALRKEFSQMIAPMLIILVNPGNLMTVYIRNYLKTQLNIL
jgi:hypothetical protein